MQPIDSSFSSHTPIDDNQNNQNITASQEEVNSTSPEEMEHFHQLLLGNRPPRDEDSIRPSAEELQETNALREEGRALLKSGKYRDAYLVLDRVVKRTRFKDPDAWCDFGASAEALQRWDTAIECYNNAQRLDPHNTTASGKMQFCMGMLRSKLPR